MTRWIASVLLTLGCCLSVPALAQSATFETNLKIDHAGHTVFVQVRRGEFSPVVVRGTGILLPDGFVLTSLHLVPRTEDGEFNEDIANMVITGIVGENQGIAFPLTYIAKDDDRDLVLFRFTPGVAAQFEPACISDVAAEPGDAIGVLGFPLGLSLNTLAGTISGEEAAYLVTAMGVTYGSSGSGVYNTKGEIVGIVKGGLTLDDVTTSLSKIVPIRFAGSLLSVIPDRDLICADATVEGADTSEANAELDVSYMRLSGAISVPLFVQAQSLGGVAFGPRRETAYLGPREEEDGLTNVLGNQNSAVDAQTGMIAPEIAEFWAGTEYRDAMPLATELWTELARDGWAGHRLVAAADRSAQDLYCILTLTAPWMLGSDSTWPEPDNYIPDHTIQEIYNGRVLDYVYAQFDREVRCSSWVAAKVGFLFLIVKNTGSEELRNVKLSSLRFEASDLDPAIWRTLEAADVEYLADAGPDLLSDAEKDQVSHGELQRRAMTNIAPGDSFIWLLSIYRTAPDFYEERYLRVVEVPTQLDFVIGEQAESFPIRLPRRGNALPVAMPFGWYHQ